MMFFILNFFLIMIIIFFMLFLNFLISKKKNKNRDKLNPFECGFDPVGLNRIPFSLQFYLIGIIFLLFDVEIALILPMIKSFSIMDWILKFNLMMIFLILLIGLFLEWKEGALNWFK